MALLENSPLTTYYNNLPIESWSLEHPSVVISAIFVHQNRPYTNEIPMVYRSLFPGISLDQASPCANISDSRMRKMTLYH
jgi:hypothetical protein